jgi:organic hydroperoxide reductase OsmC/OhrA
MFKYPIKFKVQAEGFSGIQTPWTTKALSYDCNFPVSIPVEYQGPGKGVSPEDLFAMALQNCFIATFKVFAEKSKLEYKSILIESELEVDLDENKKGWMARINMVIKIAGSINRELAQHVLTKTSQGCMVLNSVNTKKNFRYEFLD